MTDTHYCSLEDSAFVYNLQHVKMEWVKQIPSKWLIFETIFTHIMSLTIQDSFVHLTNLLARGTRCQKHPANEKVYPYSNG